jgi:ketosteroid isomerase-like protein
MQKKSAGLSPPMVFGGTANAGLKACCTKFMRAGQCSAPIFLQACRPARAGVGFPVWEANMRNACKYACIVTIVLLAISAVASGQQSGKTSATGATAADKALETRFTEYADALKKKDTAALDKIWADDYHFINPHGDLVTKAQRLENVKSGATSFEDIQPQREQLSVKGNIAVDIGRVTLKGTKYSGKESSGEYRYMNVWTKEQGKWRLVANQVTLIKK